MVPRLSPAARARAAPTGRDLQHEIRAPRRPVVAGGRAARRVRHPRFANADQLFGVSSMSCRKDFDSKLAALKNEHGARGRRFWRSLEELSESDEFRRLIGNEFPAQASIWPDSFSRRKFL